MEKGNTKTTKVVSSPITEVAEEAATSMAGHLLDASKADTYTQSALDKYVSERADLKKKTSEWLDKMTNKKRYNKTLIKINEEPEDKEEKTKNIIKKKD